MSDCMRLPRPAARMTIFTKSGENSAGCAMLARRRGREVRTPEKSVLRSGPRLVNVSMPRFIRSTALALVFLAAAPAWAQVYKWVDDKGVVNYSSRPPVDRESALLDSNSVSV